MAVPPRTELSVPDVRLLPSWRATVLEFGAEQMHGSGCGDLPTDPDELAAWATYDRGAELVGWLRAQGDPATPIAADRVHCDYRWILDPGRPGDLVGFVAVRHRLNDFLLEVGGHIGYSVRPGHRRRGHASRALARAVVRAGELGLDRVLVTCQETNVASARTIEGAGGVLEDVRRGLRRYWIDVIDVAPGGGSLRARGGSGAGPR